MKEALVTDSTGWVVVLGAIAILFNPIIPIYLGRGVWAPIDVISAGLMAVSGVALDENVDEED